MGFFSSLSHSFLSKIGSMPLIPIPPIAFRILLGFCFAVSFLTLSLLSTTTAIYYLLLSTIYCFQGFFYIHFKHPCFSHFEKNKPNNKHQALHAILCPLCLIASLFSLLLSNFSKNKKIICIHYPSKASILFETKRSLMTS